MSRSIKFRAWDRKNKQMVAVRSVDFSFPGDGEIFEINTETYCHFPKENDTVVLMQFTGLHDKNGKEIWEGDVVKVILDQIDPFTLKRHPTNKTEKIAEVFFAEGKFQASWWGGNHKNVEVLGNAHEHPELLK